MTYLFVIALLVFLIYHFDIKGKKVNRIFYYNLILVILTIIAGMRFRFREDTTEYLYRFFHETPYLWNLTITDFAWDAEPLWYLLNSFIFSLGGKWFVVQFIQAFFVNSLVFRYFRKHSEYIFSCVLVYVFWMYTVYTMQELRASMSVVICLFANDLFLEKKWIKGYLLFFLACLFHKSTYVLVFFPLLFQMLQSNLSCCIILACSLAVGYITKARLGDYIGIIEISGSMDGKINTYMTSDFYGEGNYNINFLLLNTFPFLFYPILSLWHTKDKQLLKLKPLLIIGMIFIILRFNIVFFYRYIHFYACYFILFISQLFIDIIKDKKAVSLGVNLLKACLFFIPLFVYLGIYCRGFYNEIHPYTSIIERRINMERERKYGTLPGPKDEY